GAADAYASLAADGTLYWSSTRAGGRGSWDLYRARPAADGYGEPQNLTALNGEGSDIQPCVAPDTRFLFFVSTGRPDALQGDGAPYPRPDLYISFREGDGWSKPLRLPPPVNTTASESSPALSPDGRFLFFSSDRSGFEVPMKEPLTASALEAALGSTLSGW